MSNPRPTRWQKAESAVTDGSGIHRVVATALTTAGLLVGFGVYCLVTRPLNPRAGGSTRHASSESSPHLIGQEQSIQMAERYLAHAPWATTASWQGQTSDGSAYYYFRECKQESANVVRFHPFALIWKGKHPKANGTPHTIVSDAAYVTFASKFSFPNGNPGPIVRAGLEGEVRIEGPHDLKILGHNFFYEREAKRIYSDNNVRFHVDQHDGSAKGMQIELIPEEKAKPDEAFAIAGISSVKLLQNVNMTLTPGRDDQPAIPGAKQKAAKSPPDVVEAHSDGSFNFVLATHVATFERNIRIRRATSPGKFDSITADQSVELTFEPDKPTSPLAGAPPGSGNAAPAVAAKGPPETKAAGKKAADKEAPDKKVADKKVADKANDGTNPPTGEFDPHLRFRRLHAQGKVVRLVSDANGLQTEMRDFNYDQVAREVVLSSVPRPIVVLQHANRLRAPEVRLTHDDQREITHVWCRGAGDMQHYDEKTNELDLKAEWYKEMRKYPDPKSPFDLIDLEEAIIEQPKDASGIAANHIRLWVVPQRKARRAVLPNQPPSPQRSDDGPQIDHMLAWQNVAMISPQLEAETEHLEIWFEPPPPGTQKPPAQGRPRTGLVPTAKRLDAFAAADDQKPARANVEKPSQVAPAAKQAPVPKTQSPDEPYQMTAGVIYVRVIQGGPGTPAQVAAVISKGNVRLVQAHANDARPLDVEGNELRVQNRGELDQEMVVLGQPAHVRDRGAHIEGGQIRFNRIKNTADVDGIGKLQIPAEQMPLDVQWVRLMHFDGKSAHFVGNVRTTMNDGQAKTEIGCREMRAILSRPFSFSPSSQNKKPPDAPADAGAQQPEVETIICDGGVDLESQSTLNEKLMEIRRGQFGNLVLHRSTGRAQAEGPGLLRVWRFSENGRSGLTQLTNVQSNAPPKSRKSTSWEFMQVTFDGRMDGDFSKMSARDGTNRAKPARPAGAPGSILDARGAWTAVFHDNVQVLYGPVDQPMETVSREELLVESGWLRSDTLEVQQHPQTESQDQHVTLLGNGDGQIEGKEFRGEGECISYDGSTGVFLLRGGEGRSATIWRQVRAGEEWARTDGNVMTFNPVLHQGKVDQASGIDGLSGVMTKPPRK